MLSNSNTQIIHDLYKDFNIQIIHAARSINCNGGKRGKEANEVLVTNY
jgi:DNA adenine methylase